jgi:hypothetical protein
MVPYYAPSAALSWKMEKERTDICQFWGLPAWREPSIFDKWQSLRLWCSLKRILHVHYWMKEWQKKSSLQQLFTDNKTEREHQNTLEKKNTDVMT